MTHSRFTDAQRQTDRMADSVAGEGLELSVVVPVHDEATNVAPLIAEIGAALDGVVDYELIYVDDGSSDGTERSLQDALMDAPRLRVLRHQRRSGQSAAIHSGVRAARARWIATLDGDGQNDPADIPRLLALVRDPGRSLTPDLVAGIRAARRDGLVKRVSSLVANAVRARVLHDRTSDTGCGLKLFRRDAFLALPFFDHMHRFLPALVQMNGGAVAWTPVSHRARTKGRSHYGMWDRLWAGVLDLFGVFWLSRRMRRPEAEEVSRVP